MCCGKDLPPRKRRYCNYNCRKTYHIHSPKEIWESWGDLRTKVILRDNCACQECGETAYEWLEVHHIIPINKGGDELNINNLITLCIVCHKKKHRKRRLELRPNQSVLVIL